MAFITYFRSQPIPWNHCITFLILILNIYHFSSAEFEGEGGKKHFISGRTQAQCQEWVNALRQAR